MTFATWPEIDPQTGLNLRGDELLSKAREAMIAAAHVFNSVGLTFRNCSIVTCIIIGLISYARGCGGKVSTIATSSRTALRLGFPETCFLTVLVLREAGPPSRH